MDPNKNWTAGHLGRLTCLATFVSIVLLSGCIRLKTEPIRVEPIYIEITINHRVQEVLDDIFSDLDQASQTTDYEPLEGDLTSPEN